MNSFIVSLHHAVLNDALTPINLSHSVHLKMDSGLTLMRLEDVVAKFLNHVRFTEHDSETTIDARVSGIDWTSISDMYPDSKVVVAVGSTSSENRPFIFVIQEV